MTPLTESEWTLELVEDVAASSECDYSESPTCNDLEELCESFYSVNETDESFTASEGIGRNDGESTSDINVSEDLNSSNLTAALAPHQISQYFTVTC